LILLLNLCLKPVATPMRPAASASGVGGRPLWWGVMWRLMPDARAVAVSSSCCNRPWRCTSWVVVCGEVECRGVAYVRA